jgi:hypothetical protein
MARAFDRRLVLDVLPVGRRMIGGKVESARKIRARATFIL